MKTKKTPAKPAKKTERKPLLEIRVHPVIVEFVLEDGWVSDRMHNGAEGSENAEQVASSIKQAKESGLFRVVVRHFDTQGVEVSQ